MQPAPGPSSALPRCWIQLLPGQRLWGWGRSQRVCGVSPTLQGLSPGCREAHTVSSERHLLGHLSKLCQLGSAAGTASHCCLSPAGPSIPTLGCGSSRGQSPWGRAVLTLNSCPGRWHWVPFQQSHFIQGQSSWAVPWAQEWPRPGWVRSARALDAPGEVGFYH